MLASLDSSRWTAASKGEWTGADSESEWTEDERLGGSAAGFGSGGATDLLLLRFDTTLGGAGGSGVNGDLESEDWPRAEGLCFDRILIRTLEVVQTEAGGEGLEVGGGGGGASCRGATTSSEAKTEVSESIIFTSVPAGPASGPESAATTRDEERIMDWAFHLRFSNWFPRV